MPQNLTLHVPLKSTRVYWRISNIHVILGIGSENEQVRKLAWEDLALTSGAFPVEISHFYKQPLTLSRPVGMLCRWPVDAGMERVSS